MNGKQQTLKFLLLILLSILTASCRKEIKAQLPDIQLPPTPAVAMETNWGLITSSHLRLRESPEINSRALTTLWKGYILEILSQTPNTEVVEGMTGYWYRISFDGLNGWVFGGHLNIYNSLDDAERAAMEIRG